MAELNEAEIEYEITWLIEEIINFLSPNNTYGFSEVDFYNSIVIAKLNRLPRDINDEPVDEEERQEYCNLFKSYKNFETYYEVE